MTIDAKNVLRLNMCRSGKEEIGLPVGWERRSEIPRNDDRPGMRSPFVISV